MKYVNVSADAIKEILISNKKEDYIKAKNLLKQYSKQYKNNQKKIRQAILDNIVNNEYVRNSNDFVTIMWDLFNKQFPS